MNIFIYLWLFHALPAVLLSLPLWIFGRKRARWIWWEFSILILPFGIWLALLMIDDRGKSLSNLVEVIWLGCAIPLAALARVIVGQRVNRKLLGASLIALYCLAAAMLWAFVGRMPSRMPMF